MEDDISVSEVGRKRLEKASGVLSNVVEDPEATKKDAIAGIRNVLKAALAIPEIKEIAEAAMRDNGLCVKCLVLADQCECGPK